MAAPPLIGRGLWTTLGRLLPFFLPSERCQVQERPGVPERFDTTVGREVGAKDIITIVARKTLRPKASPASVVRPKSTLKSLFEEENHGSLQPMRVLYCWMLTSGARETIANEVSRAWR
jgi:hypothetical protein